MAVLSGGLRQLLRPLARTVVAGHRRLVGVQDLGKLDPVSGWHESRGMPLRVTIPLSKCSTFSLNAFRCVREAPDPLAATLLAVGEGRCSGYAGSPLEHFYRIWQPKTAAEVYGLDPDRVDVESRLNGLPFDHNYRLAKREFTRYKRRGEEVWGNLFYGPVSAAFGEITVRRALAIQKSLEARGLRPELSSLAGYVDVDEHGDWRVRLTSGKHTAAALVTLGFTEAPVIIGRHWPPIRHRQDARSFREVRQGLMTEAEAKAVFDRMFEFRQPERCLWEAPPLSAACPAISPTDCRRGLRCSP